MKEEELLCACLQAHIGVEKEAALNWSEAGRRDYQKYLMCLFLALIRLSE